MYFTILVVNVKLAHAVEMWFWWVAISIPFFAVLAFPLAYLIIAHPLKWTETPDAPFPQQSWTNANFWLGCFAMYLLTVAPELIMNAIDRRFRTTFQSIAQEVEQLGWYKKQMKQFISGLADLPVHPELDALDAKMWADETKGEGTSTQHTGTGQDFSMDDYTSMETAASFRHKHRQFSVQVKGLAQ